MSTDSRFIDDIESWVRSGGKWRLVDLTSDHAHVELCTCTGEVMERLETSEPGAISGVQAAREDDGELALSHLD